MVVEVQAVVSLQAGVVAGGDLQVEDGVHPELRVIIETQLPRHGENAEKEEDVQLLCRQDALYALHGLHSEARHVPPGDGGEGAGDVELSVVVAGGGLRDPC